MIKGKNMREIKFRAWHTKFAKMYYSHGEDCRVILFHGDWEVDTCYESGDDAGTYPCDGKEMILMQYTGLKDKNGKEDYHKNILRNLTTGLVVTVEYGSYRGQTGVGYGWYLQKTNGKLYIPYPINLEDWEVIGNVYENPELL